MENNVLKLTFVGDIFPANLGYNAGFGVASKFLHHNGKIWKDQLRELFKDSDIVFGNLESPLLDDKEYCNNNNFAGHSSFAKFLKKNKIEIVSIANNHILEHGVKGFTSTCNILKKNNIKYIGLNEENLSNIEIIERNKIRIGFCGFNAIHNITNPNAYAELDEQNIFKTIEKLNNIDLDYRIVSLHWGSEYIKYPSKNQVLLAHKIIDSNIDVIIGHHPHVIQPVEKYKKAVIFYSLGNFIFDMLWSEKVRHGLIAKINFSKEKIEFDIISTRLSNNYLAERYPEGDEIIKKMNNKHNKLILKKKIELPMYNLKAKYSRLTQRILMKKEILNNWECMSTDSKMEFISKFKKRIM